MYKFMTMEGVHGSTYYSTDGITWVEGYPMYNPNKNYSPMDFYSVAYGSESWVAVGKYDTEDYSNIVYVSN